jgi:hypothetical protein
MPEIDFSDIECTCEYCGSDIPIRSRRDLRLSWLSTMAFVALNVVDVNDADGGLTICPTCAERIIGPEWRTLGKWQAAEYWAWIQVEDMISGRPYCGTVH